MSLCLCSECKHQKWDPCVSNGAATISIPWPLGVIKEWSKNALHSKSDKPQVIKEITNRNKFFPVLEEAQNIQSCSDHNENFVLEVRNFQSLNQENTLPHFPFIKLSPLCFYRKHEVPLSRNKYITMAKVLPIWCVCDFWLVADREKNAHTCIYFDQ